MAKQDFINQLIELGYEARDMGDNKIVFKYMIPIGKLVGQEITIGFLVKDDFPANPPSGPHVSPRILPINTNSGSHPNYGIHESKQFGSDWEYWSRPFPEWGKTDHTVRTYLAHIRHLFETL